MKPLKISVSPFFQRMVLSYLVFSTNLLYPKWGQKEKYSQVPSSALTINYREYRELDEDGWDVCNNNYLEGKDPGLHMWLAR